MKKLESKSVFAIAISCLLLISMLALISNSAFPSAKAQSTSGTTISPSLINDIYASAAGNNSRSFVGLGPGPSTPNLLWTANIPGVIIYELGGMTAFGGFVFVQNKTDTIALNAATGSIAYVIPSPSYLVAAFGALAAPEYIGGNYMLVAGNCYTVDTGQLVWAGPPAFAIGMLGAQATLGLFAGGALVTDPQYLPAPMFFCSGCGWELTNPAQPPTVLWNDTGKAEVPSGVGAAYDDGVMVYNSAGDTFSGFNAATGAYLWTTPVKSYQLYGATASDGVFAWGAQDGNMYGWNITTGKLMWTFNPNNPYSLWSWSLGSGYGMIYGHNQDAYFYAVNATTGALVWDQYVPNNGVAYSGSFTMAGGYVYVEMGQNEYRDPDTGAYGYSDFCCYNAYTGALVWSAPYENGSPSNAQCNAYGNLYMIPTTSSSTPGVYTYASAGQGGATLGEVICIGPGSPQSWPMSMNDAAHTSLGWGPTNLTPLWSKGWGNGGGLASSPSFANGIGYIGSTDHNIYAFNATNGNEIWNFTTKAIIQSTPAVVNGYVYTGADDGNVYCLNALTGTEVWNTPLLQTPAVNLGFAEEGTQGPPSPMVVGDNLYVGANNYMFCLNANTGAILWKFTWGAADIIGTPSIVNNVVYVAPDQSGPDGFLYELNAQTGTLIMNITIPYVVNPWIAAGKSVATETGQGIEASPTVDSADNIVFVQQVNERTFAINATSGKILWTYDAYYDPGDPAQWGTYNLGGVLYAGGNCYFNEWYDIVCVNALSGNVSWTTFLSRESDGHLTCYGGNIYAVTNLGFAYVLNAGTGAKESFSFIGTGPTDPVPYGGNLYIASADWDVTCFTQAAAQVAPTPTPTPTPTPAPTSTPPPSTPTPLRQGVTWDQLYVVTLIIIVAVIISIALVAAAVLLTLRKIARAKP